MEHFNYQRAQLKIPRGLEKPGKTRFAGVFHAGVSIQRGLPAFEAIVDDDDLDIDINVSFDFPTASPRFANSLSGHEQPI